MDDLFVVKFLAGLSKLTKISPPKKCSLKVLDKLNCWQQNYQKKKTILGNKSFKGNTAAFCITLLYGETTNTGLIVRLCPNPMDFAVTKNQQQSHHSQVSTFENLLIFLTEEA